MKFTGLGTALITPFKQNGDVDFDGLENLVKHQLAEDVDMLIVMGTTGEAATLDGEEKQRILDEVIEINDGKAQIIYGIGGNNTGAVVRDLSLFNTQEIDGILSVSPAYNKPAQEGIFQHYKAINDETPLPVIIYNVPSRTGSNILPETVLRIAELENMVSVKEASGNMTQVMEIIKYKPDDFSLLSGDDGLNLSILACGGEGLISVVSNVYAKELKNMITSIHNNDLETAREEQYKVLDMIEFLFAEGNPAGIKASAQEMGICESHLRLPLIPVTNNLASKIYAEHKKIRP